MNSPSLPHQRLVVFGGLNGWGKKIAKICKDEVHSLAIVDIDTPQDEVKNALKSASTVFLAAPDTEIQNILLSHQESLRNINILDCATNKRNFADQFNKLSQQNSTCSTHPMVRSETSTRGQNVLIMPVGEQAQKAEQIAKEIFTLLQMNIRDFSFEKHAELMIILQLVPHLFQRVLIATMGHALDRHNMSIEAISNLAPANFAMTELSMGRVAIQQPAVSAGIILEGLQSEFGKEIIQILKDQLAAITETNKRDALMEIFSEDILQLGAEWKQRMEVSTDVLIEAIGNLKARSFQLIAHKNEPGLLGKVCAIFGRRNINMTAMHSSVTENEQGGQSVRFDIGIDDCEIDWSDLENELLAHEFHLIK